MSYKRNDTPEMKAACLECEREDCDGECELICEMRRKQSNPNMRRPARHLYTIDGRTQCLTDWCKEYGVSFDTVRERIKRLGMPVEEALKCRHIPSKYRRTKTVTIDGETLTIPEWANRLCIHNTSIYKYVQRHDCDLETAVRHYMAKGR